jgi:hypothetical protein
MSMHHGVADGRGAWRFIEAWSSASRVGSPVTEALGPPYYGREVVSHPRGGDELARVLLKIVAPNLPVVRSTSSSSLYVIKLRIMHT